VTGIRYLRQDPAGRYTALEERPATAEALDLLPHPQGGWYRQTWAAEPGSKPPGYPGRRAAATAIYFLLPPGEPSRWHAVRSDELWLWHAGGPLTLQLGGTGRDPAAAAAAVTLGPDLAAGQRPQQLIPAGHWQAAAPAGPQEVLVTCVVAPGFDFADFTVPPLGLLRNQQRAASIWRNVFSFSPQRAKRCRTRAVKPGSADCCRCARYNAQQ
jgi:predicted cupin superfamily sugar epimerase